MLFKQSIICSTFLVILLFGCFRQKEASWLSAENRADSPVEALSQSASNLLNEIVDNSAYVGIGDSIHTTGGQYKARIAMIKDLIQKKEFRLIGFEDNYFVWETINEALSTDCPENIDELVLNVSGAWRSKSVSSLFGFICAFNEGNPENKIQVFGLDSNIGSFGFAQLIRNGLSELGLHIDGDITQALNKCVCADPSLTPTNPNLILAQECMEAFLPSIQRFDSTMCFESLARIESALKENHANLRSVSEAALYRTYIGISGLKTRQKSMDLGRVGEFSERDLGIAQILVWARRLYGNHKTIFWGANAHVRLRDQSRDGELRSTGYYMDHFTPGNYKSIGVFSYETDVLLQDEACGIWPNGMENPVPRNDSLEGILRSVGSESFLTAVPSQLLPSEEVWEHTFYLPNDRRVKPGDYYHGAFFLKHSPAMECVSEGT